MAGQGQAEVPAAEEDLRGAQESAPGGEQAEEPQQLAVGADSPVGVLRGEEGPPPRQGLLVKVWYRLLGGQGGVVRVGSVEGQLTATLLPRGRQDVP